MKVLTSYDYKSIDYLAPISDLASGFLISHGGFGRLHALQCEDREALFKAILDYSAAFIGVPVRIKKDQILYSLFQNEKFGQFRFI